MPDLPSHGKPRIVAVARGFWLSSCVSTAAFSSYVVDRVPAMQSGAARPTLSRALPPKAKERLARRPSVYFSLAPTMSKYRISYDAKLARAIDELRAGALAFRAKTSTCVPSR